ncbi:hypothetical protein C8Q69DRAFT_504334 [Paecilomyces variotii]|uniref:Uncharacterized protein n=1 Tax=Byssochlamys spectabilis TaxID=264951 RepID=A0A443I0T0_BYSSP|nr:hypothetical protein C8Q69DRAFT_504334 [Paecilomyces variotii]RWQ97675.1 hypothetical protein C8Q69DRAFT_504334 [Paecilomyces variotii]
MATAVAPITGMLRRGLVLDLATAFADGSEISIRSAIGVQDAEWGIWDMLELRGTQVFRETIADRETSNQQVSEPPSATSGGFHLPRVRARDTYYAKLEQERLNQKA